LFKQSLWVKNITIRMGVVNTTTIPLLLQTIQGGKLDPSPLITHRLPFSDALRAYDIFRQCRPGTGSEDCAAHGEQKAKPVKRYAEEALIDLIVEQVLQRV
jgi:hypothetical protein